MANRAKGEVGFEADGKAYVLVYSVNALCELEAEFTDMSAEVSALLAGGGNRRVTTLRTVFRAGLSDHHPNLTAQEAGRIMGAIGLPAAFDKVAAAMALAFPQVEEGAAKAPPFDKAADADLAGLTH